MNIPRNLLSCLCVLLLVSGCRAGDTTATTNAAAPESKEEAMAPVTGVYQFSMPDINGKEVSLSDYQGKVILIVNTASKCGFTPQYDGLEKLYERYKDKGFAVLGFPANNFGNQEPGSNDEIKSFCSTRFNVTFPLFAKSSVKGDDISPLYAYLTGSETKFGGPIGWNFTKFLVDGKGQVIARFSSRVTPLDSELEEAVKQALEKETVGSQETGVNPPIH